MPSISYLISGTTYNSASLNISDVIIKFTSSSGSDNAISNSTGQYLFDLAEVGYSDGETITYFAEDKFKNEIFSGSFVVTGGELSLDITLSGRDDPNTVYGNRDTQIFNIGGKPVSEDNPLPVTLINTADLIDLTNNPNQAWTYDSNGRVISETTTIKGITYKRTFAYTGSNFSPDSRSKWVRQ